MQTLFLILAAIVSIAVLAATVLFKAPAYAVLLIVLVVGAGWAFYFFVLPKILAARAHLSVPQVSAALQQDGKVASSWWTWITGFRTQIMLFLSVLAEAVPQIIYKMEGVDMTNLLGPKIGSIASIGFMVMASFFHAKGLQDAAATPPAGKDGA